MPSENAVATSLLAEVAGYGGAKVGLFDPSAEGYKAGIAGVLAVIGEPIDGRAGLTLFELSEADAENIVESLSLLLLRFADHGKEAGNGPQPAV